MKLIISLLVVLVLTFFHVEAQLGKVILLKGKVEEYGSNKPLGLKLTFIGRDGKKVIANSNSTDGSYQAVLNGGEKYKVIITDHIIVNGDTEFELPVVSEYKEIYKHFTCSKLSPGMILSTHCIFNRNDDNLIDQKVQLLSEINELLSNNPRLILRIIVSTEDSWFPPKSVKINDPKSKNKKKTVTITTEEQLKELLDKRISNLRKFLLDNGIREKRIDFEPKLAYKQPEKTRKTKGKKSPEKEADNLVDNITISVSRLMNL